MTRKPVPIALPLRPATEASFWDKIDTSGGQNSCWEWTAARTRYGYGQFRGMRAHRLAHALKHGSDPKGLHICHSCDNPPCCNPSHLFAGTAKDNVDDRNRKGRGRIPSGGRMNAAKLTTAQVVRIRDQIQLGMTAATLSCEYGVTVVTIRDIRRGKTWQGIGDCSPPPPRIRSAPRPKRGAAFGERHGSSKLTAEQVHAIRELLRHGVSQRKIARDFGIAAQSAISKIACGKAWHLEPVQDRAKSCRPEVSSNV